MHEIREPLVAYGKSKFTEDEYLAMEEKSEVKHEYYKGEIFAMAGAGDNHNEIFSNLMTAIGAFLKGKPCKPYGSDKRMYIAQESFYTYPDISVYCKETNYEQTGTENLPTIIIEILSESTEEYDRGKKSKYYKSIPSLKEYIMIDSQTISAEILTRKEHPFWQFAEYRSLDDVLKIESIDFSILLSEIYEGTKF